MSLANNPTPSPSSTSSSSSTSQTRNSSSNGANSTFHRKPLPKLCVSFESAEGIQLFTEALRDGYLVNYFPQASVFQTQSTPAYCGLASLAMTLNSLNVDPQRTWQGIWRWFTEDLLDCCVPLRRVQKDGVSLDEAACLARCNGAFCELYRPPDVLWRDESVASYAKLQAETLDAAAWTEWVEQFRSAVRDSCMNSNAPRLVCAYDRRGLAQVGSGHFSPIGGYHEQSDRVLILDVARFKYPPHWCPLEALAKAMLIKDRFVSIYYLFSLLSN